MSSLEDLSPAAQVARGVLSAPARHRDSNVLRLPFRVWRRPLVASPEAGGVDQLLVRADSRWRFLLKRGVDIASALIALTLFGLMLPVLALLIKLDSPGPVFYTQTRIGRNRRRRRAGLASEADRRKVLQPGRPFTIYKLRTMCANAEQSGPQWAAKGDARVTRVGRVLRKTRLDEVPQFINVLRGEMSLIGPRPERLCFIRKLEKDVPHYRERLLILPGITGLAQVVNGYDESLDSVRRKVELDRQYIREYGLKSDVKIVLRTIRVVLTGEGAC